MTDGAALFTEGPVVPTTEVESALGWTLKPEGLCRDDQCVLVPDRGALAPDGGVDLRVLGVLLDRPVAVDEPSGVTAVGVSRQQRRTALHDLVAPDFVLPDIDGTSHALSDHRSKKKLLVAFSTW